MKSITRRDVLKLSAAALATTASSAITHPVDGARALLQVSRPPTDWLAAHEVLRASQTLDQHGRKRVALTYDDWPRSGAELYALLYLLRLHNAKASFFFLGESLQQFLNGTLDPYGWEGFDLRQILIEGHDVGTHGWQHEIPATELKSTQLRTQLSRSIETIQNGFGLTPKYYRAPFGARNDHVLEIAADLGLQHVLWNVESGGLQSSTAGNVFRGLSRMTNEGRGAIVLSHMWRHYDLAQANEILTGLNARGYIAVRLTGNLAPADTWPQPPTLLRAE